MTTPQKSTWASGGLYEPYVGRWSRLVAQELLTWLAVPGGNTWLDVGCGTGALTETSLKVADPARVVGIDPAEGFVSYARAHLTDFDDYWSPFLGGQAPAPGYAMSLTEEGRAGLREYIRRSLPIGPDGSIHLVARAWAVRGRPE